jgi:hypothetical protein
VFHTLETLRTTSVEELVLRLVNTTGHHQQHAMQVRCHHLQESEFRNLKQCHAMYRRGCQ